MSEAPPPPSPRPEPGLQGADPQLPPTVQLEKVYVKDISLEIPHAPQIFAEQLQPQLAVQISTQAQKLTDNHFEVTVTATVTARAGERTVFLAEAVQAGIFLLANITARDLEPVLAISCPSVLYPYLRESISDLVARGGFPPVLLTHMTFDALYVQRVQAEQAAAAQKETAR